MLKTHRSDEGSSSPTAGVFLSLSGVERAPGVLSNLTGHHFSAHHVTLRSVCFQTSHLLGEVYCDFPLSAQGTAEAQTGHRLKTKPRFETTIQSDFEAQL